MSDVGGYDSGYARCSCFWGRDPGSLIKLLVEKYVPDLSGLQVLDAGCGEGKNSAYLAALGANVRAIDISVYALGNARNAWPQLHTISWECNDIRNCDLHENSYDIVVMYGLLHCLQTQQEIEDLIVRLKTATRAGGMHVLCAFNDRRQELEVAHPGFVPTLLDHRQFLNAYSDWSELIATDTDIREAHPHNNVWHTHSLTRIIAQKGA